MTSLRILMVTLSGALFGAPLAAHNPTAQSVQSTALPAAARSAATVVDYFHDALRRGDTKSAAGVMAEDALIFESGGVERTKAGYASHHLAADAAFSQAVRSVVTRRTGGATGTLAWIATQGRTTGSYKGKALDLVTTETMVLRRSGTAWRIIHVHWSSGASK